MAELGAGAGGRPSLQPYHFGPEGLDSSIVGSSWASPGVLCSYEGGFVWSLRVNKPQAGDARNLFLTHPLCGLE